MPGLSSSWWVLVDVRIPPGDHALSEAGQVTGLSDWPGTIRLPEDAAINIKNRSFSLVAEIDNPDGDAEGMLFTLGGETGGYALFVLEGKPTFVYNWLGVERYPITSPEPLPQAESTIRFDFAYDGGGPGKGGGVAACSSTIRSWPKVASTRPCRSTSQPTTPSMSERTGALQCRTLTSRRSPSPARSGR